MSYKLNLIISVLRVVSLLSNPVRATCCISLLWFLTLFNPVDSWLIDGGSILSFWLYDKLISFFFFLCNYFLLVSLTSSAVSVPHSYCSNLPHPLSSHISPSPCMSLAVQSNSSSLYADGSHTCPYIQPKFGWGTVFWGNTSYPYKLRQSKREN